jgi:hypothetical protein
MDVVLVNEDGDPIASGPPSQAGANGNTESEVTAEDHTDIPGGSDEPTKDADGPASQ